MKVGVKKLRQDARLPRYAHEDDAALDLATAETHTLLPGERHLFSTGIAVEIPRGYFGLIRGRSGFGSKHGLISVDSGIIDAGYRGEVLVLLYNSGDKPVTISKGERFAQLLILPVARVEIEEVEELSASSRAGGGFGSTGK